MPNRRAAVGWCLPLLLQCAEYLEAHRSFQFLAAEPHPMPQGGTRVPFTPSSLRQLRPEAPQQDAFRRASRPPPSSPKPCDCGIFPSASIRFTSRVRTSRSPLLSCARSPTATTLPVWQLRPARTSWKSSTGQSGCGQDAMRRAGRWRAPLTWRNSGAGPTAHRPLRRGYARCWKTYWCWIHRRSSCVATAAVRHRARRRRRGHDQAVVRRTGRVPKPPAPAYEQVIHGQPWKLLTNHELLYLPRNPGRTRRTASARSSRS